MNEVIIDPIISTPVKTGATNNETSEYLIYYVFGFLEILLSFRLILKLAGASLNSGFVRLIYSVTSIFTMPFEGIFRKNNNFEPSTFVAILVYILIAWGIVKLVRISSGEQQNQ
ncbi:MAG: YggT family protein [Candidatus Shapirobacteria bacterium]